MIEPNFTLGVASCILMVWQHWLGLMTMSKGKQ
jgi:hypothetical protein